MCLSSLALCNMLIFMKHVYLLLNYDGRRHVLTICSMSSNTVYYENRRACYSAHVITYKMKKLTKKKRKEN